MKHGITLILLLSLSILGNNIHAQQFLEPYKWKNRVIILVADTKDHPDLAEQLRLLEKASPGVSDRDLVILSNQDRSLSIKIRQNIEENYGEGFRFILIGKDGTVKKDSREVVAIRDLFSLIDSMPMRQREMEKGDQ